MKRKNIWTDEYIKNDLLQINDTLDNDLWLLFTEFFREEKGYDDWTDEEINFSLTEDDIDEFIEYLDELDEEGDD